MTNRTLLPVESFTYLTVTVYSNLRWHEHAAAVSAKATRVLNLLRRNINFCTPESRLLPLLPWSDHIWNMPQLPVLLIKVLTKITIKHKTMMKCTAGDTQQLEGVQRRGARFVHKDYRHTTSVSQLLSDLSWSPFVISPANLPSCHLLQGLTYGICPISLDHPRRLTRPTRSVDGLTFINLPARVDCYKYSFLPRTVIHWNTLATTTRSLSSVNSFHNSLHVFIGHTSC